MNLDANNLLYTIPRSDWKGRFRELLLYICGKGQEQKHFGAIKLNKILYYCDFTTYERLDFAITGAAYRKLKHGPAPECLVPVREEMIASGLMKLETRTYPNNDTEHRLVALREADLSIFHVGEIEIVDEIIERFADSTGTELSELSHDIRWKTVTENTFMPYEMVWMSDEPITSQDIARTKELASKHGWE